MTIPLLLLSMPAMAEKKRFDFEGQSTSIVFADDRERTVLSGNARIVSEDTFITASEIEVYGEDFRYAICSGGVELVEKEHDYRLTSESLFFDRESKIARAEGNAVMEDIGNELVIKGNLLESRDEEDTATVQVGVRILGEDVTARSEFARYNRASNVLELSGLPVVYWKGDEYRAARIVVDLDNDTIILDGNVSGSVTTGDTEEDEEDTRDPEQDGTDAAEQEAAPTDDTGGSTDDTGGSTDDAGGSTDDAGAPTDDAGAPTEESVEEGASVEPTEPVDRGADREAVVE